jgi:UDPglucose--hexose-1-phosphate uridylyltransferase
VKAKTHQIANSGPAKSKPMAAGSSEFRRHYYLNRYVIIAPKRNLRPDSFSVATVPHTTETSTSPAIEKDPSVFEIMDANGKWAVKVVNNLYPAVDPTNPQAYGKHEVIIETPEHNVEFSELPVAQIERIFQAYQARSKALMRMKGIRYVAIFKNDGPRAGASIAHAHSQVVALPMVPPLIQDEADAIAAYMGEHETCPHCDIISWEDQQKVRVIFEDKNAVAISPYAASFPFAAWIMPREHVSRFSDLNRSQLHSYAVIMKKLTASLDVSQLSFNFFLHDSLQKNSHHFYIKIEPRATTWAGLELSTGIVINPVPPEYAALWYQGKIKS